MQINPSEVTKILKEQIKKVGEKAEISEVGQVLSVGDGIARVYGLDNVQAGEMVEFSGGIKGMALNLDYTYDPDLIAGLIIQIGSIMIDTSVKTKLKKLEKNMLEA